MAIIYLSAGNVIPLLQVRDASRPDTLKVEFYNDTLLLQSVVVVRQSPIRISNTLNLTQFGNYNPKKQSLTSVYNVNQNLTRSAITLNVNSYLAITDASRTVLKASASNVISFSSIVGSRRSFSGQFQVSQTLVLTTVRNFLPENDFEIRGSVSIYKYGDPTFIGVPYPSPVPSFLKVQLVCGTSSLELDVPEIGNGNEIEHLRINRETRAGERIIYKDPMWPVLERFTYNFTNLSNTQASNLLSFITQSLGKMITLTDHENIVWSVQLKNPDAEVRQEGHCSFSTELEFEGSRV